MTLLEEVMATRAALEAEDVKAAEAVLPLFVDDVKAKVLQAEANRYHRATIKVGFLKPHWRNRVLANLAAIYLDHQGLKSDVKTDYDTVYLVVWLPDWPGTTAPDPVKPKPVVFNRWVALAIAISTAVALTFVLVVQALR